MKLRNKKTGEIVEILEPAEEIFRLTAAAIPEMRVWEEYDKAEPLIKDEKVRKAVRAWAEMNDIRFIHMCSRTRKENARIVGQNALGRTFTMEIDNEYEIRVCFKDYKECYTVAELCGEEEE